MSFLMPCGLRRLLSRANRHPFWNMRATVWGSRLAVPTADRLLYVTLHQLGLMGAADRRFYEAALRPGMTVLDIGANIGLCTQLFARLVGPAGKVHAFEPAPELCRALEASCVLNGAANVAVHPFGLGEGNEDRWLHRSFFNSGDNRVRADAGGGMADSDLARVLLRRGDDLLAAPITADFIKIDVQGWELHALRGIQDLIDRSLGLEIYLEFWPEGLREAGTEPAALFEFFQEHGMTVLHQPSGTNWVPVQALEVAPGLLRGQQFVNLRAVKAVSQNSVDDRAMIGQPRTFLPTAASHGT